MLMELIYYLDILLDQEGEGHHRAERVQNTEVSCVRLKREEVRLHQPRCETLLLTVYEGTWTQSPPLVTMHLLDRSCVIVGKLFEILRSPTMASEPGLCVDDICTSRTQ